MAVTVGGTSITFNDGTVQSTAAAAVTTTAVLSATAGATAGAVGTYAWLTSTSTSFQLTTNTNYAGSSLRFYGFYTPGSVEVVISSNGDGATPSGTWKCMGYVQASGAGRSTTLFLRIS